MSKTSIALIIVLVVAATLFIYFKMKKRKTAMTVAPEIKITGAVSKAQVLANMQQRKS